MDAHGRTAPSYLGVLTHYKAVVWYTGDDFVVRGPNQVRPGGPATGGSTGTEKLFDDEILASRDFMNEGGKLLVTGKNALEGAWEQFLYNPLGPTPPKPLCPQNTSTGQGALANDPPGQNFNCVAVSNDFQQYWLGAYLPISIDPASPLLETPVLGSASFGLNGPDSADNQDNLYSLLTTSSILDPATYPQFKSDQAIKVDGPPAFDPPTGSQYVYSQQADSSYKRLTHTVDLTGKTSGVADVQGVLRHRAGLRLRVRRGPHRRPGRLDDAARREREHEPGHRSRVPRQRPVLAEREPVPDATTSPARARPTRSNARRPARAERGTRRRATRPASRTGTST